MKGFSVQENDLSSVKVGDRLWSTHRGWVTVKKVDSTRKYPIYACDDLCYTFDGKYSTGDLFPTLFWDEIKFEYPKKPLPKLEVDTKVIVWNNGENIPNKAYFSHFNKLGEICCFHNGTTSWSNRSNLCSATWDNWELADA